MARATKAERLATLYTKYRHKRQDRTQKQTTKPRPRAMSTRVAEYEKLADEVWRLAVAMGDSVARMKERVAAVCVRDYGTTVWHYDHVLAYVMRLSDASGAGGV